MGDFLCAIFCGLDTQEESLLFGVIVAVTLLAVIYGFLFEYIAALWRRIK